MRHESDILELKKNDRKVLFMKEEKSEFLAWVKSHKMQLILMGISVSFVVGTILFLKNEKTLTELKSALEEGIKMAPNNFPTNVPTIQSSESALNAVTIKRPYTPPQEKFSVSRHIRTMSPGRHHSLEKEAEAVALGIDLLPNQTLVRPYTKCAA